MDTLTMEWISTTLTYRQTGYFTKIITDYLDQAEVLRPFYAHPPTRSGMQQAVEARKAFSGHRQALVGRLKRQYQDMPVSKPVQENIEALLKADVFTVCTAHQPAIFTGSLYFIYKILHTIRLASRLTEEDPDHRFVPVFFMGSEDADLDELGKIWLNGEKLVWNTTQTGSVGRMETKGLEEILYRIEGELSVQPFGAELIRILKGAYLDSPDVQTATFRLIHTLFAEFGLLVLIADDPELKRLMIPVFEDDLFHHTPSRLVDECTHRLAAQYKVQANPR